MRYTFGTNEIAARRLEKIAEIFNPHSSEFIKKYAGKPVVSAAENAPVFRSLEELAAYAQAHGAPLLKVHIENDMHLVGLEPGRL